VIDELRAEIHTLHMESQELRMAIWDDAAEEEETWEERYKYAESILIRVIGPDWYDREASHNTDSAGLYSHWINH
jgi:hypothetical protein